MTTDGFSVVDHDVRPVNKKENRGSFYAKRVKIHPKRASGFFRRLKWIVMAVTLSIYYVTPWLRWDRGPGAPNQAVLIDFAHRRFYFFFIELWPQEVYYMTGLLIMAGIGLFFMTSVAGRVWCGYTCPQTVWTDLFLVVERAVEGDRNARIKLDAAPFSLDKLRKRVSKHAIWLLIAMATGGAWVFYFADAPMLARELAEFQAPMIAYATIALLTLTTYVFGGLMREQVCTYMCPWPRIQGAMLDEESLVVTYHGWRGEPRSKHLKAQDTTKAGDCIDCGACVVVCPAGIDIRDGQQLECITCALCIDACNGVMKKLGRPANLIGYDTLANDQRRATGHAPHYRLWRPRTILYAALWSVLGLFMIYALATRADLDISALHDRNPLFVRLTDGGLRNGYTIRILNKQHAERHLALAVEGLAGAQLSVVGQDGTDIVVPADDVRSIRVYVSLPAGVAKKSSANFSFGIADRQGGSSAIYDTVFRGPE